MAIDWGNALNWGTGGSLYMDDYGGVRDFARAMTQATHNLAATAQNEQLLRSLGYGGGVFNTDDGGNQSWSPEALQWLASQGYSLGVGHQPGTSSGGRAEYWGLLGPNGKYVQGQSDPTTTMSEGFMDQITPFLMMLPAVGGIISAAGGAAAGGAGAAGGLADAAAPTLGAGASDVAALGSAWSPEALGLTGGITPAVSATEIAGLGAGIPGAVGGLGAAGGVSSLGSAWSPQGLGLTGGITPGASAADLAALSQPLPGAVAGVGAGSFKPSDNYGQGMTGSQTSAYDNVLGATGSKDLANAAGTVAGGVSDALSPLSNLVGGGQNLAGLIGAAIGATQGGGTTTATTQSQIDPRMAQYLYGTGYGDTNSLLGAAQQFWQQNKSGLNPTMQQGLDMQRAALTDPAYGQSYTQMRNLGNSLMSAPVAGNPYTSGTQGGLLGPTAGRTQNLMARGRGLLG